MLDHLTGEIAMTKYDPRASGARRFPRVISPDEINSMPRLKFAPGIDTSIFLSQERDDARQRSRQGTVGGLRLRRGAALGAAGVHVLAALSEALDLHRAMGGRSVIGPA
jgi:hypothetical protein